MIIVVFGFLAVHNTNGKYGMAWPSKWLTSAYISLTALTCDGVVIDDETCEKRGDCQFIAENQRLVIEEAGERDAGRYSCVAENVPGRDEKDIVVSLLMPPIMKTNRTDVEIAQGNARTLVCPIDDTSVSISWTKDELPIRPTATLQILNSGRSLHLTAAEPSDSAEYSCKAVNEAGDATAYFDVTVLVQPKVLGPEFRNVDAISNDTVRVACKTTGIPAPTIEWYHDDEKIKPSSTYEVADNGTLLKIHNIQGVQAGRYTCVAKNKVGKSEANVFVEVSEIPQIVDSPSEVKIIAGSERTIKCHVKGVPKPDVTWKKNGETVEVSGTGERYIHIAKAQPSDAGRYTCIAANRAGERRHNIQVHVLVPPVIAENERILKAIEGNAVSLKCAASGVPKPEIRWFKNGIILPNATEEELLLPNLTSADATKYSCEARNEAGSTNADFVVDVFVKPRIRNHTAEVRVVEGEKAKLDCKADGNPPPTVTWLRGGRKITDMTNFLLSPLGESLMILKTKTTDAGSYSCVAKNSAGESEVSFGVTVLTAPYLPVQVDQNPKVIHNNEVTLQCPVRGNPEPKVEWRFNGKAINANSESYKRSKNDLIVKAADSDMAGRYTCHAVNEVNFLDTDYALEVIAPPKIGSTGQKDYEVLSGDSITMICPIETTSLPSIIWLRGGNDVEPSKNIQISADGLKLTIVEAALEDNGKYVCSATNVAGTANIDVFLKVYVAPTIDDSNLIENPLAVLGKTIFLECPADGIPQPTVTWMRDDQPIEVQEDKFTIRQNNITFGILNVQTGDAGKYSCIAENKGGRAEEHFFLQVLAPPLLTNKEVSKVTKREGDEVTLLCPVQPSASDSIEERDVTWVKDGRTIGGTAIQYGGENGKTKVEKTFTISKDGYRLTIPALRLEDAGDYRCLVANRAGEVSGRFIVETLSKPTIDPSRAAPEAHVIQGRPYTINCPVSGHPFPAITWFKERVPVDPAADPTVRVIDKGQKLEILSASPGHKGLWTCAAENDAGDTELNVRLDVWTPPAVTVKPGKEGAIRPLGTSITLFCEAAGNPAPIVHWQFEGRVLIHSPEGTQLSDGNARLDIPVLKLEDAGGYTCSAKNEVGTDEATIVVDILVPSKIDRDGVALNQRLPAGQTLTLFCDVKGKPLPKISWYANDTLIDAAASERIKIGTGGEYIEITNIALVDHGIYRCLAENAAGNDTLDYKVEVDQKPSIVNSGTFQTHEGKVATLTCNVTGEPAPKITWLRNGMRLETNVHYIIEKNTLKIMDTRSDSDSGIYLCMAQNEAGSVQQAFTLEVYVAPKIQSTSDNETVVAIGEPFSLACGAFGHPLPEITWEVNDEKLETLQAEHRIEDDVLYVKGLKTKGTSVFRCTVHNAAGIDEIEYTVKVIAPPTLTKDGIQSLNITEGEPTIIVCDVDADVGEAEISWTKNGIPVVANGGDKPSDIVINNHGKQLKIAETVLTAEGTYVCTAVNSAGNATQTTKLYVGAPPKISEDLRRVTVKRGEKAEILCEAVGMPPPKITWLKDNKTMPHVPVEESKATAIFDDVEPDQAGVYTCIATNWAGTVSKDVDLLVLIPPAISEEKLNFTANPKDNVILPCNATGIPEPVVSWTKNPNVDISGNSDKFQILGSSLAIKNVSSGDDGFYHCIAKSEAGQAVATRKISVSVPLIENRVLWAACDEKGDPIDGIFKQARGDLPDIDDGLDHWDDRFLNESNGAVVKCLPTGRNARTLVKPTEGAPEVPPQFMDEPPSTVELAAGDEMKIACVAVGPPVPEVYFVQDGTLLPKTKSLDGKTELILNGVKDKNNAVYGNYACLAKNSVGEARKDFTVTQKTDVIVLPPRPPSEMELTVLDCMNDAGIVAQEHVAWKLDGAPVGHLDDSHHAMNNGSLVLKYFAMEADMNGLSCFIDGKPGGGFGVSYIETTDAVPVVKIKPQRIYAQPGTDITIDCHLIAGNPLTTRVRWSVDNVNLAPDGDKFQVLPNNTLVIRHGLQTDRGDYKCRGWNGRGKSWDGVKLFVEDAPSTVNSKISGSLNDKKFGELILKANFTPNVESNDISVTIDNLAGDHATVSRSIISVASMPLVMLGYDKSGESRSIRKRPAKFERRTKYDFDSGESLFVKQKGKGMSEDSFDLDIEVEGSVPKGERYDHAEFEPWEEELIEDAPGHLTGNGRSAVTFGQHHRVPFKWSDSIDIEDDSEADGEYIGKGETFRVISEPTVELHSNEVRVSTKVGRLGRCPDGYYKNKERCRDVDECKNDPELCGPVDQNTTICVNLEGTYECRTLCPDGFKSNIDGECIDIDECILDTAECAIGQECQNTEGGYDCKAQCTDGYETLEDGECVDINECLASPCVAPMTCKNLMGTYACVCPPGFPLTNNGTGCKGLVANPVRPLKVLDFAVDKHNCPPGYYWDKGVCEDIGECEFDAPCEYKCTNLPGSYECECPDGYIVGPTGLCEDIDECKFDDVCLESELCFNELGRYSCLGHPCPKNYVLNRDSLECLPDCRPNTNCTETHPVKLHMLRLRNGIEPKTPLIRLTASDVTGRVLRRSNFGIRPPTQFYLKNEAGGSATVFNKNRLDAGSRHQIYIRSSGVAINKMKYKTDFLVFLSVSEHPF
uniref:Hemicentin-1 n=1 Tax=Panagrellus redivivus TaxID=6233 RepID=A0A7E4UTJ4_PANRE